MPTMQQHRHTAQTKAIKMPEFASILIVDDQRFDRARLRRMCEQLEFNVLIAEADTLESMGTALQVDTYDLIFIDFHLPDGSGLQALDAIYLDPNNNDAATIMVTGNDQVEIAIDAMKNGCSDFLKKDSLSAESVRRATINALQKANLTKTLQTQETMRHQVEAVLDRFSQECADDLKPMLVKMMRHVRDLNTARTDPAKYDHILSHIGQSCDRLLDFMCDIGEHERKMFAISDANGNLDNRIRPKHPENSSAKSTRLFGRRKAG